MSLVAAVIKLVLVLDPLGNAVACVPLLKDMSGRRRAVILVRESLVALGILFAFLLGGRYLLNLLDIREPVLSVAGGVVLFLVALRMIFTPKEGVFGDETGGEPYVVPIATPLLAGPSAVSVVMLLASSNPTRLGEWSLALVIAWAVVVAALLASDVLVRVLGRNGSVAVQKLMGMILTVVAVQLLATGVEEFLAARPGG